MGLALWVYLGLALTGTGILYYYQLQQRPQTLHRVHQVLGWGLVALVSLLLAIGMAGTLGQHGSLGQSEHFWAGLTVEALVLMSAGSGTQLSQKSPARYIHITINGILFFAFVWVLYTGWSAVQKLQ